MKALYARFVEAEMAPVFLTQIGRQDNWLHLHVFGSAEPTKIRSYAFMHATMQMDPF